MSDCARFYIIKDGDTLFSVAASFDTTVQNLLRLNPNLSADNLTVGEHICVISGTFQPVRCEFGSVAYNINQGDTLFKIADEFGTDIASLREANPTLDPYNLTVGERICIPQKVSIPPPCPTRNFYVIQKGDTLGAVASSFNISVNDIISLNPDLEPYNLSVGQIICIPLAPSSIEIIVNIAAKRLVLYRNGVPLREYIVSTGKPETPTPVGVFEIVNKEIDPGGPYGTRWLGLSASGYGIHGTNDPASIGKAVSNGCIRMYNEDAETLFNITPVGTVVRILP